ncbi:MAG: GNAT family N-acetyltransferase [Deltaproteobacteria bacterium]|nr:GNAT family N-acetyltransferase [Deltaproteobacteria bacterium]
MFKQTQIFSRRLILRKPDISYKDYLYTCHTSEEIKGEYLSTEKVSINEFEQRFSSDYFWNERSNTYVILLKDTTDPVGVIRYWVTNHNRDVAAISVLISDKNIRSRGFGTEAQKSLIISLFSNLNITAVEMYTDIDNLPQQKCLNKLGFDCADSVNYQDKDKLRTGLLYRLCRENYNSLAVYRFHYE